MAEKLTAWVKKTFASEKSMKILVLCGIAGMVLIFLSGFWGEKKEPAEKQSEAAESVTGYEEALESRLSEMLSKIDGGGRVKVLVTVRGNGRKVYVSEQKTETVTEEEGDETATKKKISEQYENEYIRIKNSDGGENVLLTAQLQPEIQGVAVVCDGGEDTVVQQRIIDAVTTVLNISSSYVCVTKMAE